MKEITVELFTDPTNNAVIRVPGRHYPGVLIQGDTLRTLYVAADQAWRLAVKTSDQALADVSLELRESLSEIMLKYESVLGENQIPLPYPK